MTVTSQTVQEAKAALVAAHFGKALKLEIRRKLAWALADDASLDDLVKRAAQIDREMFAQSQRARMI